MLVPITGETRAAFFNAGAEAVENAVKLARLYTGRQAVIAFDGAFHGRTWLALTMTSKTHPYKKGLGPFAPEVYRAPFPNAYRGPDAAHCARGARADVHDRTCAPTTSRRSSSSRSRARAASSPPTRSSSRGLRRICDEHGIVLVADEVQTGFGRTGRMFAMEHFDVEADLMIVAKSIAGGLPLSGVIGRADDHGRPARRRDRRHVHRQPGRARGRSRCSRRVRGGAARRARELVGDAIRARMLDWQARWPRIGDVRGLGAMLAIELVRDPATKTPAPELAEAVIDEALQRGLILLKAGVDGNCIRVLCPLTIADAELDEASTSGKRRFSSRWPDLDRPSAPVVDSRAWLSGSERTRRYR